MSKLSAEKYSVVPVAVMISFTLALVGALIFRVYRADRDLGLLRIAERQARLASEAGIFYAMERMRAILNQTDRTSNTKVLTPNFFANHLEIDQWKEFGIKTDCAFRIIGVRKVASDDIESTPLINEELRFQVISEGRCGRHRYTSAAVIQLYDLSETFAVFSSLDEFYYGKPIQPWVEKAQSLDAFVNANSELFDSGKLDRMGVCYDPGLLYKMFSSPGADFFKAPNGEGKLVSNYGSTWFKSGNSPANGPIYCKTPIVVDSHTFFGPVQTALYFYRRGTSQPRISKDNSVIAINSSLRVQHAADSLEGKNPGDVLVDRDSPLYCSYIPEWRPDFNYMRELAKKQGIYIDETGRGFRSGTPTNVDYHPGEERLFSDSYKTANSVGWEQDELDNKYVILSTETKFAGQNNLSSENLGGASIIFSERSVYLRGDIGSDLVIATPRHIFITGPTNVDSNLNLFLVGGHGTALSTVDLEKYIRENKPGREFIDAAREWLINALIYKPGAGVYTAGSRPQTEGAVNFRKVFGGASLKVTINGGCIGGNLKRWIDNMEPDTMKVQWKRAAASRLPVKPLSANILRLRTRPDR
ncbi:MAG: hypothetical protein Kow0029_31480 [Candidatus Rifleibacteriota bacterium]